MTQQEAYSKIREQFEYRFRDINRIDVQQFENFIYLYDYANYIQVDSQFIYDTESNSLTINLYGYHTANEEEEAIFIGSETFNNLGLRPEEEGEG